MVIHGCNGMDEANLAGETAISFYHEGKVTNFSLDPQAYGFTPAPIEAIVGGDAAQNAAILTAVLKNHPSVYLETVVLNAGLGFYANGNRHPSGSFAMARACIASGAAYDKLQGVDPPVK